LLKAVPNALIVPFAIKGNHLINHDNSGLASAFVTVTYTAFPAIDPVGRNFDEVIAEAETLVREVSGSGKFPDLLRSYSPTCRQF
jgi:hypothetical protein